MKHEMKVYDYVHQEDLPIEQRIFETNHVEATGYVLSVAVQIVAVLGGAAALIVLGCYLTTLI